MSEKARKATGWQLDRAAPEAYERYLVPPIFAPWADRLLDQVELRKGDRIVDVACGTGVVARRAAARVGGDGAVVGLDINEGMLAVAEETAAAEGSQIEWRQGDATDLPFSEEDFDVVCCQQALQFFEDPATALGEMRRVLAPGGRAALSVWRPIEYLPGYIVLAEALEQHIGDKAGAMMRSPFPGRDDDSLRTLARDAGFDDVSVTINVDSARYPSIEEFVRREAASSPLSEQLGAVEPTVREALVREVEDGLQEYIDDEGTVFPMESYVLTAHRS